MRHGEHVWPAPLTDGVYRVRNTWDDWQRICWHAVIVGPAWMWEGPCRDSADVCEFDLAAERDLRVWLGERAA